METKYRNGFCGALAYGLAMTLNLAHAEALFIVTEPWVRLAPNARSAEAFMQLRSTDGAKLVAVRCDVAGHVAIRKRGATLDAISLPAGTSVMLAPDAYRFELANLNRRLKLGDRVGFVITIEAVDGSRQEIPVNAEVRRRSPTDDHRIPHSH